MALQSQLFHGDSKLEDAATIDTRHIQPGANGSHVEKIQKALIEVAGADITPNGDYNDKTASAVAEFKKNQKPQILNYKGKIDDIVGIKTMAALDAAMLLKEGKKKSGPTLVDIVVNLIGAPGANPKDDEEALPLSFILSSYNVVQQKNRKQLRHKISGNLLLRLAHGTTQFGPGGAPVLTKVAASIVAMLAGKDPDSGNDLLPGKTFILGSSSGGRCAIEFAGMLAQSGNVPHFVASIDASFTQADTVDRPSDNPNRVLMVPTFTLRAAAGALAGLIPRIPNRHNFFQSKGNHRGESLNPFADPFLTSDMAGNLQEIHGKVESFLNHEVLVTGAFGQSDDNFHEECDALGRREAQIMIANALRGP